MKDLKLTKINPNQTLFDIAIQMYGHIEGVIWLLEDNSETSFETIGTTIFLRKDLVKPEIVKYLQEKRISISTAKQDQSTIVEETHNEFTFEFNFEFN